MESSLLALKPLQLALCVLDLGLFLFQFKFLLLESAIQIIDFVDGPDSSVGDAYTDVIVKFNVGHQYLNTTGI